jgi:hypothetical protein
MIFKCFSSSILSDGAGLVWKETWKILNLLLLNHAVIPPPLPSPNGWTQSVCRRFFEARFKWSPWPPLTEIMNFERNSQCFIEFPVNFLDVLKIVGRKKSIFFHLMHSFCCPLFCHLGWAAEGGRATPVQLHPWRELFCHVCHGLDPSLLFCYLNHMQQVPVFRSPVTSSSTDYK